MKARMAVLPTIGAMISALVLSACGGGSDHSQKASQQTYAPVIHPADFSARIENRFLPFKPGTTFVYKGTTAHGPERVVVTVTHTQRKVMGVTTTVVRDVATLNGKLEERTYDWYAQDRSGNVWYFGEDSSDYKNGKWVPNDGSWEAGVHGAKPGIVMKGQPRAGDRYRQEYYRGHAEDMAAVVGRAGTLTVPFGSFKGLVVTREWTPLEPGVAERKYYASGVGEVRSVATKGPQDESRLVAVRHG